MTASRIFLYFCLSFIVGIFISSLFPQFGFFTLHIILCAGLILGILLISVFWKHPAGKPSASNGASKNLAVIGFSILFLVLGIWRHQQAELRITNNELRKLNDSGKDLSLIGVISDEPDIREKSIKLTITAKQLTSEYCENCSRNISPNIEGRVLVTASRYPEYQYGDKLKITGKLETPPIFEGFNYKDYLKKDGIYSIMSWPEIEEYKSSSSPTELPKEAKVRKRIKSSFDFATAREIDLVGVDFGNPIMKALFSFKNKFKETARQFISPPQEGFLEALLFGDESNISKDWKTKLNLTGTRHIAAVSGMNITIIGFLILSFVLSLGLWRQQAFFVSIFLLLLYILMVGAPASAVRAGIMAGILMIGQYFGRLNTGSRAVVFAASFMLLFNPLLLKLDVGFQLSFLAILGIVYLQPIIFDWFKKIPNPKIFPVRTTLSATLSAQFFTLPILIYNFGYIPLLSPITNILIVPFLAPITILIFVFGIAGMISSLLGLILSWPTWLFLTYIVSVVGWFSMLPFVSLSIKDLHWIWLIVFYLILGSLAFWLNQREKLKFLRY